MYNAQDVVHWDREDWKKYLLEIDQLELEGCLLNRGISPLLYIFEKCILPFNDPPSSLLVDAAQRFATHPPELTARPLDKIGEYQPSKAELYTFKHYFLQIKRQKSDTDYKKLIEEILTEAKRYPGNPQFYNLAIVGYGLMEDYSGAYKLAKKAFSQFPNYIFAKINYMDALVRNKEYRKVEKILNSKYLLEDLYPDRTLFHYSEYKHYYRILIDYLFKSQQFVAGWIFYKAFIESPYFRDKQLQEVKMPLGESVTNLAKFVIIFLNHYEKKSGCILQLFEKLGV